MKSTTLPLFRRPLVLAAALLSLVLLGVACGDDDASDTIVKPTPAAAVTSTPAVAPTLAAVEAFPQTVTDVSGTDVVLSAAPRRIISYSPGATEVLFAVGAGDQVVGTDEFSDYPPATAELPKLAYTQPAPEPALALDPDLVIMAGNQEGQVAQFRSVGMTVLLLREPSDFQGVVDQVRLLGRLTGHDAESVALANEMQMRYAAVQTKVADLEDGPNVFVELTPDGFTVGDHTFIGALLTTVKARNVASVAGSAYPQLSAEAVIDANPDVVLLLDGGASGGQSLATVRARPGWDAIAAVRADHVYEVDANVFSRPGPRVVDALEALVALLYADSP